MWRLGLDVGTHSIGWAALELNKGEVESVLGLGVRLFPDGREPAAKGRMGDPLNQKRRLDRGMRRNRNRKKDRIRKISRILTAANLIPPPKTNQSAFQEICPYEARTKAAQGTASDWELGRALLHLSKRRAYCSNAHDDDDEKDIEKKKVLAGIQKLEQELAQKNETLGHYLYHQKKAAWEQHQTDLKAGRNSPGPQGIRFRGTNEYYASRQMVKNEFDAIQKAQNQSPLSEEEFWQPLKKTLFFQRPLKLQIKAYCTYLHAEHELRCYKATPSFQRYRLLKEVNTLKWLDTKGASQPLNAVQREEIIKKVSAHKKVTFKTLSKVKLNKEAIFPQEDFSHFNLETEKRNHLEGNETLIGIEKLAMAEKFKALTPEAQDELITSFLELESDKFKEKVAHQGFEETAWAELKTLKLPKSTANLSAKFCRLGIKHLEKGFLEHKAVQKVAEELGIQIEDPTTEHHERLPYYGKVLPSSTVGEQPEASEEEPEKKYGKIGNPTVHVALNQIRYVINDLISKLGHPEEIIVETGRDLKNSREGRKKTSDIQTKNQKENDRLAKVLTEHGVRVGAENLKRCKLWEELGEKDIDRRCVFSGKQISFNMVINGEAEVEHLLPRSRTLDNSMNNLTLSLRQANHLKGQDTPYEAFGQDQHADKGYRWEEILERAQAQLLRKFWRFGEKAMEEWEEKHGGFIDSQLIDNAYISKKSRQYLGAIVDKNKIWSLSGRLTAELRGRWELNALLNNEDNKKNREDHRHHAIDAFVIGMTDRSLLQRMCRYMKKDTQGKLYVEVPSIGKLRPQLKEKLATIPISYKPDHGHDAAFFRETAFGHVEEQQRDDEFKDYNLVTRQPIATMTYPQLKRIRDIKLRQQIEAFICRLPGDHKGKKNEKILKNKLSKFTKETGIHSARFFEKNDSVEWIKSANEVKGYVKSAYCFVDIWKVPPHKKSKKTTFKGEFVSYVEAKKGKARKVEQPHPAAKRMMRLYKQDVVKIKQGEKEELYTVFGFSTTNNKIDIRPIHKVQKQTYSAINVIGENMVKVSISPSGLKQQPL